MRDRWFPCEQKRQSPLLSISASSACIVNKRTLQKSWLTISLLYTCGWLLVELSRENGPAVESSHSGPDAVRENTGPLAIAPALGKPHNMRSMTRAMLQLLVWSACVASPIWRKVAPPCSASMSITVVLPAATGPLPPPP